MKSCSYNVDIADGLGLCLSPSAILSPSAMMHSHTAMISLVLYWFSSDGALVFQRCLLSQSAINHWSSSDGRPLKTCNNSLFLFKNNKYSVALNTYNHSLITSNHRCATKYRKEQKHRYMTKGAKDHLCMTNTAKHHRMTNIPSPKSSAEIIKTTRQHGLQLKTISE